jgi:hypothetical protein
MPRDDLLAQGLAERPEITLAALEIDALLATDFRHPYEKSGALKRCEVQADARVDDPDLFGDSSREQLAGFCTCDCGCDDQAILVAEECLRDALNVRKDSRCLFYDQ